MIYDFGFWIYDLREFAANRQSSIVNPKSPAAGSVT